MSKQVKSKQVKSMPAARVPALFAAALRGDQAVAAGAKLSGDPERILSGDARERLAFVIGAGASVAERLPALVESVARQDGDAPASERRALAEFCTLLVRQSKADGGAGAASAVVKRIRQAAVSAAVTYARGAVDDGLWDCKAGHVWRLAAPRGAQSSGIYSWAMVPESGELPAAPTVPALPGEGEQQPRTLAEFLRATGKAGAGRLLREALSAGLFHVADVVDVAAVQRAAVERFEADQRQTVAALLARAEKAEAAAAKLGQALASAQARLAAGTAAGKARARKAREGKLPAPVAKPRGLTPETAAAVSAAVERGRAARARMARAG